MNFGERPAPAGDRRTSYSIQYNLEMYSFSWRFQ